MYIKRIKVRSVRPIFNYLRLIVILANRLIRLFTIALNVLILLRN